MEECQVVGYELIHSTGQNVVVLTVSFSFTVVLVLAIVQFWGHIGILGEELEDYYGVSTTRTTNISTPILSYIPVAQGHIAEITYGRYADKSADYSYTWEWIESIRKMGWVQQDPEPAVTIFCSDGLKEVVNEILEKNGRVPYK